MLKLKKIAVTGGLSSGKSTFCRFLGELGATSINADAVVHQLLSSNTLLGHQIINLLGADIVRDERIDRSIIASKVFSDFKLLEELERLLHPAVFEEIEKLYQRAYKQKASLFVAEIPLLFEAKAEKFFDATIAVITDEESCLNRFLSQGYTLEEYELRKSRQLPQSEKALRSDFVLYNNGTLEDLKEAAKYYYHLFTAD